MIRGAAAALAAAVLVVATGCSGGHPSTTASTTTSVTTVAAATAAGGVVPSVATTAIPGGAAPAATSPSGTVAAETTSTIPLATGSSAAPPPTVAPDPGAAPAPTTAAPGPASPPVTDIVDGNPDTFCPAVDRAVPLYYMMSLGSIDGDATAAAYEVAVAPALTGPLNDAASGAPSVVAPPFQRWAARTALAVGAFKAAGATDAQVASFGKSYGDQIEALTDAGGPQTPPDPVAAAAAAGIDRNRLATAANSFVQANGTFESFAATLSQDVTLTPAAQQKLEQLFPCAADLTNFAS